MIDDRRLALAGVPVRVVSRRPGPGGPRPAVLFYHGLGAAIADQDTELFSLARRGYAAVGVDAVAHGRRRDRDLAARLAGPGFRRAYLRVLRETVAEVPALVTALADAGLVDRARLAVAGISMGGYITYGAARAYRGFRAAVPILGSPRWDGDPADSPARHPGDFYPTALLSLVAGRDENVPPGPARRFARVLAPRYAGDPGRLAHREFPESGHFMRPEDWHALWAEVLAWLRRYLPVRPDETRDEP